MTALTEATALLAKAKATNDPKAAQQLVQQLKLKVIEFPSLPPELRASPTAQQELTVARDVLELAVLVAIRLRDDAAMERAFAQAKAFYTDTRSVLPPSPHEPELLGLNLLRLLVANRIAEFHTELELIPPKEQAHPYVANATQLERWLMQGSYNKLLTASNQSLSDLHAALMSQLAATVREEVASCSERAYDSLRVSEAQRLLMLNSDKAVLDLAAQRGWRVEGGRILFSHSGENGKAEKEVPPMILIQNALVYAKELERIV